MVSRNFILPEYANYVFAYYFFLRNLLYLICKQCENILPKVFFCQWFA